MSKDIIIQEGGASKRFSDTAKVRTVQAGGGSADWIPESSMTSLNVVKNGRYEASKMGTGGFSTVDVNVPSADGNTYDVNADEAQEIWVGTLDDYITSGKYETHSLYIIVPFVGNGETA